MKAKKCLPLLLFLLTALFFMINGCCKDEDEPCCPDPAQTDTLFIIGRVNEQILVHRFDTPVIISGPWHSGDLFSFDVDGDGKDDFEFNSVSNISPGGINAEISSIQLLESGFELACAPVVDSLFRIDTTINGYTITKYFNNFYQSGSPADLVSVQTVHYPGIYTHGDTISIQEQWSAEDRILSAYDASSYDFTYYNIISGIWHDQYEKYILFRKVTSDGFKYGWLCITVTGYKDITFFEYALQK